ncbi:MAG: YbjQ family protein [Gracilimonas sp.]|uniref:YbjQ family protein n=1 Tax=Gracilimonas sp. TaxID=1974203 RepID=UPI00198E7653|nr:YbjQ family protein [Gracilimonas sp.]MBD3617451.1 YbjQ family protein [Gracilimonas sp.]
MECDSCGKTISSWGARYGDLDTVFCKDCFDTPKAQKVINEKIKLEEDSQPEDDDYPDEIRKILLTTESNSSDLRIKKRLGIVTSECVLGMNIFRDVFAGVRDIFGGQSNASQKVLMDLKEKALLELKSRAYELGADAVIAIDLDYNEFSGGGKSMLFLVASGTAVKLHESDSEN